MVTPKKPELILLAAVLSLLAVALIAPGITQGAHHHAFADQRVLRGIPFAMDVLSNLSFALWGIAGAAGLHSLSRHSRLNTEHALAGLFFAGLLVTSAASAWYHLQPDDAGLGVDRLAMVIAFASLLGLAISGRVSCRAGVAMFVVMAVLGALSVGHWMTSGNVLPWLVFQFGGMALVLSMAMLTPLPGALAVRWGSVIAIYFVAKLLEVADHQVFELTSGAVSGHSLKHLVASFAAWPVMAALVFKSGRTQNQGRIHLANSDNSSAH